MSVTKRGDPNTVLELPGYPFVPFDRRVKALHSGVKNTIDITGKGQVQKQRFKEPGAWKVEVGIRPCPVGEVLWNF